jgi:CMP-N-acetylneuraminic acid synthetase
MKNYFKHVAVIPARKNSKSLPFKNRFLFKHTAEFLRGNKLFDEVYVNSDDLFLKDMANKYNFNFFKRQKKLATDKSCIKEVFVDMNNQLKFKSNTFIWLFYIPLVYKNNSDFKKSIKLVEEKRLNSICAFKKTDTHPMSCWYIKKNKPFQFIKNDLCRRQDFPLAYSHHHYISGFNVKFLNKLNNELIYKDTYPILLNSKTSKKLIEVDTPEELKKFKKIIKDEKTKNN